MVASNDTPAKLQMPLGKLAVTLLVTAFCSQFSNIALHLLVTNFVNGGIYASASPYSTGIATAVFIVGGPIFLGWI